MYRGFSIRAAKIIKLLLLYTHLTSSEDKPGIDLVLIPSSQILY